MPGYIDSREKGVLKRALLRWYRGSKRDLPWRRTNDPYAIWVSEIMLQQTRVEQGLPYYERFLRAFPDVTALAKAGEQQVLKVWEGLGYYGRARNLHKAARLVVEEYGGQLPKTAEAWQALPGVGRYTAGAIASIAFDECAPIVDGNVMRVLSRWFNIERSIDEPATQARLWDLAEYLVQGSSPGDFNQTLMELGARVCTPGQARCHVCPVRNRCEAYAQGVVEARPVRGKKRATPRRDFVVLVFRKRGRYLVARRPPKGLLGGLWELPSGEVQAGESHATAFRRVAQETLGVEAKSDGLCATLQHAYSHFRAEYNAYRGEILRGNPEAMAHTEICWLGPADMPAYPFSKAHAKILDTVLESSRG